jgi:hypothetical protein
MNEPAQQPALSSAAKAELLRRRPVGRSGLAL